MYSTYLERITDLSTGLLVLVDVMLMRSTNLDVLVNVHNNGSDLQVFSATTCSNENQSLVLVESVSFT